jgi:hypothetical protein
MRIRLLSATVTAVVFVGSMLTLIGSTDPLPRF